MSRVIVQSSRLLGDWRLGQRRLRPRPGRRLLCRQIRVLGRLRGLDGNLDWLKTQP